MISKLQFDLPSTGSGSGKISPQAEKALESFEALFISHLVRGLKEALTDEMDGEGGGFGKGIYGSLMDQTFSEAIAHAGGIGLKEQLLPYLSLEENSTVSPQEEGGKE